MKRSILLTSLLFALSTSSLLASTNVPSLLEGDNHWDKNGSPYLIQGKVTIPSGSHLTIDSAVQVVFQGAAVLEVDGALDANGSAAGPVVFNLIEGGLQSEIFINGGDARFNNVKILSGVFLAKDAKLSMDGADVTKGSGIYLQGATTAHLKNNKIYGNSTGVVLDGQVVANLQFNTLVQNTYGLYVKSLSSLTFQNNSIHDNQMEVVSQVPLVKLGGNYWGVNNSKDLMPKIQGKVSLRPMRTLKDVLRIYVRNELPVITQQMSLALAAKERKAEKDQAVALKKYKEQMKAAAKAQAEAASTAPAAASVPVPSAASVPPVPAAPEASVPPPAGVPPVPSTSAPSASTSTAPETTAASSSVPPVPEVPDMGGAAPPPVPSGTEASTIPVPPSTSAASGEGIPAPPDLAEQVPPSVPESTTTSNTTASSAVPPVPGGEMSTVPAPPLATSSTTAPDTASSSTVPPVPPVPSGDMPTAPAPSSVTASATSSTVPAPPAATVSTENPAAPAPPPVPEAPAVADMTNNPPPQAAETIPTPIPPAQATQSQMKVVDELKGVKGDIDGMQAPPLETDSQMTGTGSKSKNNASNVSNLDLPPLRDSDILPPKDLDLPPTEDMGNINMNSPSK